MVKKKTTVEQGHRKKGGYPYYLLRPCLRLAEAVRDGGGDRIGVPKSVVARALDTDQGSSSFAQTVASAKTYGIVDGTTELRLTDLGRDYFLPTSATASRMAELEFLAQPSAFAYLIKMFDGSIVPGVTILANLLGRECGIPDSWKTRVAQIFVSVANDLGIMDQGGRLRYDAARHSAGGEAVPQGRPIASGEIQDTNPEESIELKKSKIRFDSQPRHGQDLATQKLGGKSNAWNFAGVIHLETPDPMSLELWERLKMYVEILKPIAQSPEE